MKSLHIIEAVASGMLALCLLFSPVQAEISFSGDLEIDTSYTEKSTDAAVGTTATDTTEYDLGGRIKVVPAVHKEAGNLFFEAKAELLAKTDNTDGNGVQVDDVYGKIGTSSFDVQIGRFEAWNLQDESNDMLIVEAPTGEERYEANYARGRIDSAGQLALHAFAGDIFGFEGGLVYGKEGSDNLFGARPVVDIKISNFGFVAGADYLNTTPQDDSGQSEITKLGYGARIKAVLGIATLGINYASGTVEETDGAGVDLPDETTDSYGGYFDLAIGNGVLTLAGFFTNWESDDPSEFDETHYQYYIIYAHPLPVEGATIKFAVSQASASDDDPTVGDSDALGFKVRLNYNF